MGKRAVRLPPVAIGLTVALATAGAGTASAAWQGVRLPSGEVAHLIDPDSVIREGEAAGASRSIAVAIVLDASGSMNAELAGTGRTKLAVAKEVLATVVPRIPDTASAALWLYGHRAPQEPKQGSCRDIERVFPMGPVDAAAFGAKIGAVVARGYTPIAETLRKAAADFTGGAGRGNAIVLLSDGEETCGGDPCAVAEALKRSAASITTHVVGYAVDDRTRKQLECIAGVSGGTYSDAADPSELLQALQRAVAATVAGTSLRVEVLGPGAHEEPANVTVFEAGTTGRTTSQMAWRDFSVAPGAYDLVVDTVPKGLLRAVEAPAGSKTVVRIELGTLRVLAVDGSDTRFVLDDAELDGRIGAWGSPLAVLPGAYRVTLSNSRSGPVVVEPGGTSVVRAGILRVLAPGGKAVAVEVFDASGKRLGYYGDNIELVAGSYSIRVNGSTSGLIDVAGGRTVELQLGAIEVGASCEFSTGAGKRLGWYGGSVLLVPGSYGVRRDAGQPTRKVSVAAGEVVRLD